MNKKISVDDVRRAVAQVKHPAIDKTLLDLGIIKNIGVDDDKAILTLALPFLSIPIKDYLVNSVRDPVTKLGIEVEVKLTVMTQKERDLFLAMEAESWKGL